MKIRTVCILITLGLAACSSDSGLIDCPAFVDRRAECGMIPAETASQVRDSNIKICNSWERNYKQDVISSLSACIDVDCPEIQICISEANQLCVSDVSASVDRLCEQVVACGWEDITTDAQCQEELMSNQLLYMCLRPTTLDDYVSCVTSIDCGPDSEDEWYACGADLI